MRAATALLFLLALGVAMSTGSGNARSAERAVPVWAYAQEGPGSGVDVARSTTTGFVQLTRLDKLVKRLARWRLRGGR